MDDPVVQGTLEWAVIFFAMAVISAVACFKGDSELLPLSVIVFLFSSLFCLGMVVCLFKELGI